MSSALVVERGGGSRCWERAHRTGRKGCRTKSKRNPGTTLEPDSAGNSIKRKRIRKRVA